jgi:hypothetical protein
MMAFAGNAEVGMVDVHLAYDATSGVRERDYMQVYQPIEHGLPTPGRHLDTQLFVAFVEGMDKVADAGRMNRVVGHYDLALSHWHFGGENLAVGHLFMAAEALGRVIIHRKAQEVGSERDLARSMGISVEEHGWRSRMAARIRTDSIFAGDLDTHRAAREASDGLEHGFMEMSEVHRRALAATEKTLGYIRRATLDELGLTPEIRNELLKKDPLDIKSMRKIMRGRFIGEADDPAAEGQEYPQLEWKSEVNRAWWGEPNRLEVSFTETYKVICADEVLFQGQMFEVKGRLRPGQEQKELVLRADESKGSAYYTDMPSEVNDL